MSTTNIAVVGGITSDLVVETTRAPVAGESLVATALAQFPGGKGANTAIAAYRISHDAVLERTTPNASRFVAAPWVQDELGDVCVYLNGAIGGDLRGTDLLKQIESNGVNASGVQRFANLETAIAIIIVETSSGESRGVCYHGAMEMWRMAETGLVSCMAAAKQPNLVICQLSVPDEVVYQILSASAKEDVDTVLNPSPARQLDPACYRNVTHLIMNQTEAALLSRQSVVGASQRTTWAATAEYFLHLGVKNVIITLSAKGAYYSTSTGVQGVVEAEKNVGVVDSTGAGDTFVGTYAVEHLRQVRRGAPSIAAAVQRACKAAARTLTRSGAQESMPWADELRF